MPFNSQTIIRDENDIFILYNSSNNAILKVKKEVLNNYIDNEHEFYIVPEYKSFVSVLLKMDMITIPDKFKNSFSVSDQYITKQDAKQKGRNFFNLRSKLNPFNILWAITAKCNLRCIYCFPDIGSIPDVRDLSGVELKSIAEQIITAKAFKVTLTGGEALLSDNVWNVVDLLKDKVSLGIISNGTSINSCNIGNIKDRKIPIAISLDSPSEEINKLTRGPGIFDAAVNSIKLLKMNNIPVSVLITLTRYNFDYLKQLFELIHSLEIRYVTVQDLRPFKNKSLYDRTKLSLVQEQGLSNLMDYIENKYSHFVINTTELFIFGKGNGSSRKKISDNIMQCPAGDHTAYIDYYGELYPCTSLPTFKMGNLLEGNLTRLWRESEKIRELRDLKSKKISELNECYGCNRKSVCDGGCRGDALFYSGDLMGSPSRCPKTKHMENL